jgi:two-component system response regulator EvgA
VPPVDDRDRIRVVVADDHDGVRQLLRIRFDLDRRVTIVAEATDGVEAIDAVLAEAPDAIIVDLDMPIVGGMEVIPRLRELQPDLKIVVLSGAFALEDVTCSLTRGADAFLSKRDELAFTIPTIVDLVWGDASLEGRAGA